MKLFELAVDALLREENEARRRGHAAPRARRMLGANFYETLSADFEAHGAAVVASVRQTYPVEYLRFCGALAVRTPELKREALTGLTDKEFDHMVELARAKAKGQVVLVQADFVDRYVQMYDAVRADSLAIGGEAGDGPGGEAVGDDAVGGEDEGSEDGGEPAEPSLGEMMVHTLSLELAGAAQDRLSGR